MSIRKALDDILTLYLEARKEPFGQNPVAVVLRETLPDAIRRVIHQHPKSNDVDYKVEGSAGKGVWNLCPWSAVFDPEITTSAQEGFYVVYLFREDMEGVYLSLNQGVERVKAQYKVQSKKALRIRADDFRARLGGGDSMIPEINIHLAPQKSSNDSAYYEVGNVFARYYQAAELPPEEQLQADLIHALDLYKQLVDSIDLDKITALEPEEAANSFVENYAAFRTHRRIERNAELVKQVKKIRGRICEACGIDFTKLYPGIDPKKNKYIEAHHRFPIAKLKGQTVSRDPKNDFYVLCANCHRMIHRFPDSTNLEGFRQTLDLAYLQNLGRKSRKKNVTTS